MRMQSRSMFHGPLFSHIVVYTIPIILTSLLQLLFNAADLVVVGRFCGSISVAAVGATGALTNLIVNLFIGLSVGTGVVVAHGLGARADEDVHKTVHTAIPTALAGGIVLTVVGVSCAGLFLQWMGTPDNVLPLSTIYMRVYFSGMTFTLIYNYCASILRAVGDTRSPLIFLSLAGVINVVLNVFFVTVLHMNVAGVALATIISQAISASLVVRALMRRQDACRLELKKLRFYKEPLLKMIRIGLPAGIQGSVFSASNVIIQSSINSFGDILMSGNAAAANIDGFVYVIQNAFQQTTVNFVGQNTGARKYDRVKKTVMICLASVTVVGIVVGVGVYLLGPRLLSIYITDSAEAISWGMVRLLYVCVPYFICGLMEVAVGGLRGMGASLTSMVISILGVCGIRIVWIYTIFQMAQFHTPGNLYLSYPVSWVVTFAIQMLAFVLMYKRRVKLEKFRKDFGSKW